MPVLLASALALGLFRGPIHWMLALILLEEGGPLLIGTAFALANLDDTIMAFLGGTLADRYGRKPVILWGTLFYALGGLLLLAALNLHGPAAMVLLIMAVVMSFGVTGCVGGPASALVTESVGVQRTAQAFAFLSLVGSLSRAVGSLLFGLWFTQDRSTAILAMSSCALVAFVLRHRLEETLPQEGRGATGERFTAYARASLVSVRALLPLGLLPLLVLVVIVGLAQSSSGHFYSPYLVERFGLDEGRIGGLYSLMLLLQAGVLPLSGWFIDHYGARPGLIMGNLGPAVCLLVFTLAHGWPGAAMAMIVSGCLGVWHGLAERVTVAQLAPSGIRATLFGAVESLNNLMYVVGPVIGGLCYAWSPALPFAIAGLLLVTALLPIMALQLGRTTGTASELGE